MLCSRLACGVSQPVSLYKLLIETNRVPPVTILAACIWTFSNLVIKNNILLSHTTSAYFFVIRSICVCQLPSFEISKPKCLCSVTWLIIVLFIIRGGWKCLLIFLVIVIVSVFLGLKFTSHLVDHAWIVAMSLFNVIADSRGLSTITYKLVTSVNYGQRTMQVCS